LLPGGVKGIAPAGAISVLDERGYRFHKVAGNDGIPSPDGTPADRPMQWPGTELLQSEWFTDVRQSVIERRLTMSAHDYIGQLSTVSAYVILPPADRDQVFRRILQVLPETVEVDAEITVHLARRNSTLRIARLTSAQPI